MSRVVVITGASSGIGRSTALSLARRGDLLLLVARREQVLDRVAQECRRIGTQAEAFAVDVRDYAALQEVITAATARYGRIDALVHVAGVAAYGRFEEIPPKIFDGVLNTNLAGSVNVARAVVPAFRRQRAGHLLLVGSVLGEIDVPYMTPYVVSKWAVRALARQLSLENRDLRSVHVSCISPGGVDTAIYRSAANYLGRSGRPTPPVSTPEDVARAILRTIDRPRDRVGVGVANPLMRAGFSLFPQLFDRLVGPLFDRIALEPDHVLPTAGNVLTPQSDGRP